MLVTFHCSFMWMMREDLPSVAHAVGAAKRRRERRLRQFLRHEPLTVGMLLAESQHHATPRGQSMARSGGWERAALHGQVAEHPTPQVAGTEYFSLDVEDVLATGSRPDRLAGVRPQEHTVDQTVDALPGFQRSMLLCRSWRNSWWKYRRSCHFPRCSGLRSRPWTFQFLMVEGDSQVFKVFFPDRVQQGRLSRRSLAILLPVEVFKVFAQDRVHPHLRTLQLVRTMTRMSLVKGFFALFPV